MPCPHFVSPRLRATQDWRHLPLPSCCPSLTHNRHFGERTDCISRARTVLVLDTRVWKPAGLNFQAAPLQSRLAYWLPETQLRVSLHYPHQVQSSQDQALYPPHCLMPVREFLTQSWHRKKGGGWGAAWGLVVKPDGS